MRCHIGASGWNYRHWKEIFYPPRLPQRQWLPFYTQHFRTVELNNTFYRMPRPDVVRTWSELAPPDFQFAAKMWKGVTHYRKLIATQPFLVDFFAAMGNLLPAQQGPILIQLPPNFPKNLPRLQTFLDDLREAAPLDARIAFEFRTQDWLAPEVYHLLDAYQMAVCLHDMAGHTPTAEPNNAPFVYLRRHGGNNVRYAGLYSPGDIARDAEQITRWLSQSKSVYVYYNNDIGGFAIRNARELADALG